MSGLTTGAGAGAGAGATAAPDNTLTLTVNNQTLTGWVSVSVTMGIESVPNVFDIALTERYPGQQVLIPRPGAPCQVKIGNTVVITGYIDTTSLSISPTAHTVRVQGRGKCEDLVDCSAVLPGMTISAASTLALAQKVAAPYGITVTSLCGPGPIIPQFNITLDEKPFEIIERVARFSQMLVYEDPSGNLVLAQAATSTHASGFRQGVNVQAASVSFSMAERFSDYLPSLTSIDSFSQTQPAGATPPFFLPRVYDPDVPRLRTLIVVSEQTQNGHYIAEDRAQWEANRRWGRSQVVRLTCDNWRDSAGTLWTPNALVRIEIPSIQCASDDWVIGRVTFLRGAERGTVADLEIMPKQAFLPEPTPLQAFDFQLQNALQKGAGAAPDEIPGVTGGPGP